jgi:hypothetical protein
MLPLWSLHEKMGEMWFSRTPLLESGTPQFEDYPDPSRGCGKMLFQCHSREKSSSERLQKTGFLLSQE